MTAAIKIEVRDALDDVLVLLTQSHAEAMRARWSTGEARERATRALHTMVATAADKAFALIPRPPVAVEPGHAWLVCGSGGLAHAFPRDESGTYTRSSCGAIKKRRGTWVKSTISTRCKNCARMVAG